ncbi:TPA: class I SAM-dependent methyltransferase [Legionella pneumophila]
MYKKIGLGLEIGVGTGRFAVELGVHHGIEPASKMRVIALSRGIHALDGTAESLPYQDNYFDFALLITTLCFINDPEKNPYWMPIRNNQMIHRLP